MLEDMFLSHVEKTIVISPIFCNQRKPSNTALELILCKTSTTLAGRPFNGAERKV
jgi:hypothetical protein